MNCSYSYTKKLYLDTANALGSDASVLKKTDALIFKEKIIFLMFHISCFFQQFSISHGDK